MKPVILDCLEAGKFRLTRHVILRMAERKITQMELIDVLRRGHPAKHRDRFDTEYWAWNYAIEGRTSMESRKLRIIVSFDRSSEMLVVTAFEPEKGE